MPIILHKFRTHQVNLQTETLILGTFSPDSPDEVDFFHGKSRNFLWHLLPKCWGLEPLKDAPLLSKQHFMTEYNIDFADLIHSLEIPEDQEENTDDTFVDSHVKEWKDINALIESLPHLKAVYFTRKTFNGIPRMRVQVKLISDRCKEKGIRFCKLETPARHYSTEKQQQWIDTIVLKSTCLKP